METLRELQSVCTIWRAYFYATSMKTNCKRAKARIINDSFKHPARFANNAVWQQAIEALHSQVGLSWAEIARNFGVSESTIRRRRRSFVSANTNRESHSTIRDNELDILVRGILQITPRIGYRLVQGALRGRGLRIQRRRVLESLQRVDPVTVTMRASRSIVRRRYSVPCPNALW